MRIARYSRCKLRENRAQAGRLKLASRLHNSLNSREFSGPLKLVFSMRAYEKVSFFEGVSQTEVFNLGF